MSDRRINEQQMQTHEEPSYFSYLLQNIIIGDIFGRIKLESQK